MAWVPIGTSHRGDPLTVGNSSWPVNMTIGVGSIRPCSVDFGVDQFDYTRENWNRSIQSLFNWYLLFIHQRYDGGTHRYSINSK